jgi:hypothetical protein
VFDPEKAAPIVEHQLTMAEIMGAGSRMNIGVDQGMADTLANLGVDYQGAQRGFGQLDATRAVFDEGVGETTDLTIEDTGIAAVFGTRPGGASEIERRIAGREVGGGGGAERNQRGIVGLGTAS